jgi:two-component system, sensor histidine kinase PdtaS
MSGDHFLLTITDDGIGLPSGFNANRSDCMGMNLMQAFAQKFAQLILSAENGTRIDTSFDYEPDAAN